MDRDSKNGNLDRNIRKKMALKKQIMSDFGVKASYWKITRIDQQYSSQIIAFQIEGYSDEAARNANAKPLAVGTYLVPQRLFKNEVDRAYIYGLLKDADPEFGNADDIKNYFPTSFIGSVDI